MASIISPKADVSPKAKIGDNCKIYPFVYIEDDVVIGDNCIIYPFVSILNGTRMGNANKVFQGAVIAALPQDFNFTGEDSEVVIGDHNTIRENVVVNRGTHAGGKTVLGNKNFLMEGAHISHDTVVGDGCVFGYGTKIAGDCVIGNGAIFSTSVVENAKTRVGDLAMIQAGTTFSKDVPPYIIAGGKAWNPFYEKSFNQPQDKLVNCGLPRIDRLLAEREENRRRFFAAYPEWKEKTIILYAPTFRKNIALHWEALVQAVAAQNAGSYVLIVKGHPNQPLVSDDPVVSNCPDFRAVDLLAVCDYLITDYSAIALEGAVLNRPTYYFVYDYEEYREKNGMNIDLFDVMPGCVFRDADELMQRLAQGSYPQETLDAYRANYLPKNLGTSTAQIAQLVRAHLGETGTSKA